MFETNNFNSDMLSFFVSLGAKTELVNEINYIKNYTSVEDELYSIHNGVALMYKNTSSIIELKGTDSLDFLHRISTNSMKNLNKEEVKKTIFTSEKGRIIGVSTILNFESYLLLITSALSKQKVMSWINKYIIGDDVLLSDASHRFNLFEIIGPQSDSFLSLFVGDTINSVTDNSFKVVSADGVLFFLAKLKDDKGICKYWILAEQENGKKLVNNMIENKGPFDFNLVGDEAYNAYKIENGIPSDPNELNDNFNPHEAKIIDLIDFKKGCYIGQEVIARLDTYDKVQKNLIGLCFSELINTNDKFSLLDDQQNEVGVITSIAYSPKIKKNIALGYIKKSLAVQGTKVSAKNGIKSMEVTVHELPFKR
ncbi:MAG: glycine cleavage T C-terminal barrel domain-containing protein [Ignavibacteria bacterium]|nr:glycine cleavage T C-terminal barrel domain-containing protein [Ignavibacteria bacterium]